MRLLKVTHLYPSDKAIVLKIVASGRERHASRISRWSTPTMLNAVTNRGQTLYEALKQDLAEAVRIRIMVSFVMEKGVALVLDDLRHAIAREVPVQILASTYMGITEPAALYMLLGALGEKLDLRIYNRHDTSFHVKAYLIDTPQESVVYVGSSNISREAMTRGVEWNFRLERSLAPHDYEHFSATFDEFFSQYSDVASEALIKKICGILATSPFC